MLVLSRKINERILIGHDIVVTVVKLDRNQVRIGIEAPPDVKIWREEVLERQQAEPPAAAATATRAFDSASVD